MPANSGFPAVTTLHTLDLLTCSVFPNATADAGEAGEAGMACMEWPAFSGFLEAGLLKRRVGATKGASSNLWRWEAKRVGSQSTASPKKMSTGARVTTQTHTGERRRGDRWEIGSPEVTQG